jgi:glycosyltransferase involved in cell wall biosynthesis
MKIALIQDQLLTQGGSERVFLYMAEEFKEADLYTLCYNPETTWPEFKRLKIKTHWLNRLIQSHKTFKSMFPIASRAMSSWDFSSYDLVITSSATIAKYIRRRKAPHICYCYYPTRAIWDFDRYFGQTLGVAQRIFRLLLPYFKKRDFEAAQRVDCFVAISESSRQAIRKFYDRGATVLFCPVDLRRLSEGASRTKKDYFLLVSRLERWKLVDYAIEAFNRLGLPLRIVGQGPEGARLRALAKSNISFLGAVDDKTLVASYGEARAVVFTPELEYGLVTIEAVAAGTPVIALGRGGVLETMVDIDDLAGRPPTAILYPDPTAECLVGAVGRFERASFLKDDLVSHAASFGIPAFQSRLRGIVDEYLSSHHQGT